MRAHALIEARETDRALPESSNNSDFAPRMNADKKPPKKYLRTSASSAATDWETGKALREILKSTGIMV